MKHPIREVWKEPLLVGLFLIIPLIVTVIFLLPLETKQYLILLKKSPSLLSMFFSNYTHESPKHFAVNMFYYYFLIFILVVLLNIHIHSRDLLKKFLVLVFVFFPFINSLFILKLVKFKQSLGFSGINSAFIGFIPIAIVLFLKKEVKLKNFNGVDFLWSVFILNLFILNLIYHLNLLYFVMTLFGFLYFLYRSKKDYIILLKYLDNLFSKKSGEFFRILFVLLVAYTSSWILFPKNLVFERSFVNIPSHYLGYCFGFVTGFLLFLKQEHDIKISIK